MNDCRVSCRKTPKEKEKEEGFPRVRILEHFQKFMELYKQNMESSHVGQKVLFTCQGLLCARGV